MDRGPAVHFFSSLTNRKYCTVCLLEGGSKRTLKPCRLRYIILTLNPLHNCDLHKPLLSQVLSIQYFSLNLVLFGNIPKQLSKDSFFIIFIILYLQGQNGTNN